MVSRLAPILDCDATRDDVRRAAVARARAQGNVIHVLYQGATCLASLPIPGMVPQDLIDLVGDDSHLIETRFPEEAMTMAKHAAKSGPLCRAGVCSCLEIVRLAAPKDGRSR